MSLRHYAYPFTALPNSNYFPALALVPYRPHNLRPLPHCGFPWKTPRLPPETTDRILDCLRGYRRTLCHCALVCHAWHSRSLYNLFYDMEIQNKEALKLLVALSKKPHMMHYFKSIHELCIYDEDYPTQSFACLVPLQLSQFMSKMTKLTIGGLNWDKIR
ncbi:hypothetical protein B0H21DRAFT_461555, partial [Amylocystis lapponica]